MKTYLVSHTNFDGENMDKVILAQSPEEALSFWIDHWMDQGFIQEGDFSTKFEFPKGLDESFGASVYEIIIKNPDQAGCLPWHRVGMGEAINDNLILLCGCANCEVM